MKTENPRRTARELALQASRNPDLSQAELREAFDLLETDLRGDSAFEAVEIRKYAAETILAVSFEQTAAVTEYTDRLITQIKTQQEVLTQSPVVYESTSLISTLINVQESLLQAMKEVARTTPAAVRESIEALVPVFAEDGMYPELTSAFLNLVDVFVISEKNAVDIDPSRFWGLVGAGDESLTASALGLLQSLHKHGRMSVLSDKQTLVEELETGSPSGRRAAAELVKVAVVESGPDGLRDLQEALESQLEASNVEVRLSALFALFVFPNIKKSAYEPEVESGLAAIADSDPEAQKAAVDVFSDFADVAPITRVPIEALVSLLNSDDQVTTISVRILLGEIAERQPEKVAEYLGAFAEPIGNSGYSERSKFTSLSIIYQLAMQDPGLVVPVVPTVANEIGGSSAMHQGHQRRVKSQTELYSHATDADPHLKHSSETIRSSRVFSSLVGRSGFDVEWELLPEYLAVLILLRVSQDEIRPVAEVSSEIVSGVNSPSEKVRSTTISILSSITESHSHQVSPHLGFILDSITQSGGDSQTLDQTDLRGLFVIFRTVIDSSEAWWLSSRDLDKFFILLDAEFDDSVAYPSLGRRLALRILTSLLFRLLIESSTLGSSPGDGGDAEHDLEESNSTDTPSLNPDTIREEISEKRIQDLVALGEAGSLYEREKVLKILFLVTPSSCEQIVPHVSTCAEWGRETAPDRALDPDKDVALDADVTAEQVEDTDGNANLRRLGPHLSSDIDTVRAKLGNLYMAVGNAQPTALVPVLDTLLDLAADTDPEVSQTALSALEEALVAHRALSTDLMETVTSQLIHGDPEVEEEAAHLLSVAVSEATEPATAEMSVITVAFKQASSVAARLFLARSISIIAESHPSEVISISSHLTTELEAAIPDTLQQRDTDYKTGGADLLGADRTHNMVLVRRYLYRALEHCLSVPELTDQWSPQVLQDIIRAAPEIAPTAARRYVAYHEDASGDLMTPDELASSLETDIQERTKAILQNEL
ncbi:HEAT repeat domain-containing protein [Haloarchaeobius iranensis]|uniref:Uncharacterized protein n=1 Tax=Haloarchaeobius iranensis TaxID=996166 RepID=A0A1H0A3J4_9EURY|nr:hypothetical protein [Haloarchaeobius iranensis]SDN27811.1 hypothetical protein SAMN05192554_12425 [Haloarchaeobius iranensis]